MAEPQTDTSSIERVAPASQYVSTRRDRVRIGYRKLLTVLVLTIFGAWTATRAGLTAQTDEVGKLNGASECVTSAYHVKPGDNATIAVKNDGGWCWADTEERSYWRTFSAGYVAVTN